MPKANTPESFWKRVKKSNGCWEWQGALNKDGYGSVSWQCENIGTHRIVALLDGRIEGIRDPKHVLHKCDNRRCCRPDHLFIGTQSDNVYDMLNKGRHKVPSGEAHSNARLSDKEVIEIRELHKQGVKQCVLVKQFKSTKSTINYIVHRVTRKDI